ncbi:MAG: winged helix-turn-helix domain-containing protein [Caldimonas sp.]
MESYRFGDFEVRPAERLLLHQQQPLPLGARAFDLLLALIGRRGELITKSDLLDRVWPGLVVEEANVQVQVSGLRKVLGPRAIATIPGLGYRFALPLETSPGATEPASRVSGGARSEPFAASAATLASSVTADFAASAPVASASPATAQAARAARLPTHTDALIGREDAVRTLHLWIAENRLVTVLGPGGIGKTRVAQEVARREAGAEASDVAWVDLSPVAVGEHLPAAIATGANLQLGDGRGSATELLAAALAQRRILLVLDNCEHLVADVGRLVHALLSAAPGVCVLVTSQELLRVPGERVYRLDPLTVPPPNTPAEHLHDYTAAQLLEQRARLADRRFALTPANARAAIDLLHHLDGIPLAIEMAAARLPMLGPEALDARLSEWLRLLRGASHGVPARQHTLRATLDWSHSLLAPPEQAVLRRLSAFAGSFRIDTAQRVAEATGLDEYGVLDALAALVDKSLVQLERLEPPRYRLLETMRIYAAEKLDDHAEREATQVRHGQALAALALEIDARFWELGDRPWLDAYAPEYDDLQAAFDRACARGDADVAALTGNALQRLDNMRNINAPRRRRAEALFAMLPGAGPRARAWIWSCIASHGLFALEVVSRRDAARQAVAAWRELQDLARLHFALGFYAAECSRAHEFDAADAAIAEVRALEQPDWSLRRRMWGASALAGVCIHRDDAAGYRAASRRELELADRAGADRAAAWARLKLADAALMADDLPEAIELGHRAVRQLRELDQPSNLGLALSNLCAALLLDGQRVEAQAAAAEALPLMWRNDWGYLLLDSVALLAAQDGRCIDAALLLGFVDAWYVAHDDARQPNEARLAGLAAAAAQIDLGADRFAQMRDDGTRLSNAEAEALAGRGLPGAAPALAARQPFI